MRARSGRRVLRSLAFASALTLLAGCSEYLDRRETISLNGGDALAVDRVTQMVDPWPRVASDRNIAFNGSKMQSAVARYRTNRIIQPRGTGTSASYNSGSSAPPPSIAPPPPPPPPK